MTGFTTATGFATATAVSATSTPGTYDVDLDPRWSIGGKAHGGYLLAAIGQAVTGEDERTGATSHPHVVAASATFLVSPAPGPAQVVVQVLRTGRSASQVRASLVQDGRFCVESLLTLGHLNPDAVPSFADVPPVQAPAEQACQRLPADRIDGQPRIDLMDVVEVRLDPANLGFLTGHPGGTSDLRGWLRFADGHPPDPLSLLVAIDSFPPATLDMGSAGWVPTLELTAHVLAVPAAGPLLVRQRARHVENGLLDEACDVWDSRGRFVARAVQLAAIRFAQPDSGSGNVR